MKINRALWNFRLVRTYVQQGSFNDFAELFDLLFAAADVAVRHVGLLLDLHHRDGGVDLGREGDVDLVLVAVHANAHAFLNVRRGHGIGEIHHKLGKLLHIDDVLGVIGICIDDLGATGNLQRPAQMFMMVHSRNDFGLKTCRGCSLARFCLSAARSQSAGGASPVSDSLMPASSFTLLMMDWMSSSTFLIAFVYCP